MSWKTPLSAVVPGKPVTGVLGPQAWLDPRAPVTPSGRFFPPPWGRPRLTFCHPAEGMVLASQPPVREEAPWTLV